MSRSAEAVPSNWNKWVRHSHRWLAIAFTVTVLANVVAMGQEESTRMQVAFLPLLPLALLQLTGLYLLVLPHLTRWRSGRRTG